MCLVSVLLPYRNAEATLPAALESVLAERELPIEVVAVDSTSTDEGPRLTAELARRDPRVVCVDGRGALVTSLNRGLDRCRGTYIARMDADDLSLPGRFARQVKVLEARAELAAVGGRVEAFPEAAVGEGLRRYVAWQNALLSPEDHARSLFVESPLCHPSVMLRRAALTSVGGYREMPWIEDYDLWLRLDAAGFGLAKIPEVVLRWRHQPGRVTFSDPRCAIERFTQAKAAFLAPKLARAGRPVEVWGAGQTGKRMARALEAHGVSTSRFIDIDPRKVGRQARGAPIVRPEDLMRGASTLVVAVGARGARDEVRTWLDVRKYEETIDYWCAS